jgi:hypothetical protein
MQCVAGERNQTKRIEGVLLRLLQLPDEPLALVLKQLDACDLFSTAASCRTLNQLVPAHIRAMSVHCGGSESYDGAFKLFWLGQHSSSLTKLTTLCFKVVQWLDISEGCRPICHLPGHWPQLRGLCIWGHTQQGLRLQLEPAAGSPGVLHDCTGLTGLSLLTCILQDSGAAFAAIAALRQLQSLYLGSIEDGSGMPFPAQLQHSEFGVCESQLTELTLSFKSCRHDAVPHHLSHLSAFV